MSLQPEQFMFMGRYAGRADSRSAMILDPLHESRQVVSRLGAASPLMSNRFNISPKPIRLP